MPIILPLRSATTALALSVPTRWADVRLGQFVALYAPEPDDTRRPAELLCGLPAGYLDNLAANDVAYLANLLAFAADTSPVLEALPTPDLPDIGSLSYGTLLLAQQHLSDHPDRPELFYLPRLLALYRMELVYGKYIAAKVEACEAALLAAPVTEVYADAAFFLASLKQSTRGTPPTPTTTPTPKTKSSKPAAKRLANASRRFSAWIRRLAEPS